MKYKKPVKKCVHCNALWKTKKLESLSKKELIQLFYDYATFGEYFRADLTIAINTYASKIDGCPDCHRSHSYERSDFLSKEASIRA